MSTHYCDVISEKTWESPPRFSLLSACSLCRCIGVSHARHEQQCSSSIESQRAEPVCRSALQYAQCWLDAHAPLTQQVPRTLCALIIRTLCQCLCFFFKPQTSSCRGILPMSSRSVLNHNQQVGGPTGQSGGMGGGERGGGGGRSGSMGSPSRSSPSIIGMPKQQQARQPFTINR